ncbi:hypothetical protein SAMN05216497_12110 [Clostridium cochlearium]|uniref:Lipid II isoglutaminyl synthase (glutamine-hydrolyzing) subunit GatD n=1 Tax=Clostridium cochlearium TaxID=1494 RepID=A0ABY0QN63_CLOCO|nr:type 1 glutamine amidotransferase [Clostridium cochlearium]SDL34416.1 hypothetical protein SAMN05216497_12110 [Clostridium cochlearium]
MELNICHLYPDLLNVYGDYGNILILKYRCEQRNIKVNIFNVSINDEFSPKDYDIVLLGGGQDYEQAIVSKDLLENKKDDIKEYIENEKVLLAICGGYQLLGNYYTTSNGDKLECLGVLDIYTESSSDRLIGDVLIYNEEFDENYVGFENHSGKTYIGNLKPLGKVVNGFGNNGESGFEGCIYKNTFGTYLHGALLSKNPDLADRLIKLALKNKYNNDIDLSPIDDGLEFKGKDFMLNRLKDKKQ